MLYINNVLWIFQSLKEISVKNAKKNQVEYVSKSRILYQLETRSVVVSKYQITEKIFRISIDIFE